jgi:tRNA pseudouridine38-40 synthase
MLPVTADTGSDGQLRIRLDVSYSGTDFSGWAAQPGRRTVQGVLEAALGTILRIPPPRLTVAGRTDAGVHARGQVCHVDVPADAWAEVPGRSDRPPAEALVRRMSGILPPDVRLRAAEVAPPGFDARFSALARRYAYRVTDAPHGADPLRRWDTLGWPRRLDLDALVASATGLLGEHDFAAFCRHNPNRTTIRAITELRWRREPDRVLVATVAADAFCQSMVRSLVGAMLMVGDGRREPSWPARLLSRRERAGEVRVAPAHGLTLIGVDYPDGPERWRARAEATRRIRVRS